MSNPVNISEQHYYYLDILNIVATFAVIWLHTSEYAFHFMPNDPNWYLGVFIQVIFIWAVPIFFMISGANLLNYRERYDTNTFLKKRGGTCASAISSLVSHLVCLESFYFGNTRLVTVRFD